MPDPWDGIVAFLEGAAEAQSTDRGLREVLMGVHDAELVDQVNERHRRLAGRTSSRAAGAPGCLCEPTSQASDLGVVVLMLCLVADITGDVAPELWRRYLPILLDGLRPGAVELPVPPIAEDALREAMTRHKQRLMRAGQHRRRLAPRGAAARLSWNTTPRSLRVLLRDGPPPELHRRRHLVTAGLPHARAGS